MAGEQTAEDRQDQERERYADHYRHEWSDDDLRLPPNHELRRSDLRRATLYALEQLGDLRDLKVLELGAGNGSDTVMLARRGAKVVSTDISEEAVDLIRRRVAANDLDGVEVAAMPAEELAFEDAEFDRVFGRGMLHHADPERAADEVSRILKPGGRAVFIEPFSENPALDFAREHLPYPHKTRPRGHRGLRLAQVRRMAGRFTSTSLRGFYLLSMLNRLFGFGTELRLLEKVDEWLLERVPTFRRLCRYVVVVCVK